MSALVEKNGRRGVSLPAEEAGYYGGLTPESSTETRL